MVKKSNDEKKKSNFEKKYFFRNISKGVCVVSLDSTLFSCHLIKLFFLGKIFYSERIQNLIFIIAEPRLLSEYDSRFN